MGGWGVDGREGEDVEEEQATVVEQMTNGAAGQGEVSIGKDRNYPYTIDAIDVWDDLEGKFSWLGCSERRRCERTRCMVRSQFSSMKVW